MSNCLVLSTLALFFSKVILPVSSLGLDHALTTEESATHRMRTLLTSFFESDLALAAGLLCLGISPILRIGYDDQLVNIFPDSIDCQSIR